MPKFKKILGAVAHGADPATEKAAERQAETLQDLADLFLTEHVDTKLKGSTAALYRDILHRLVLPELGKRKAGRITANDLARLHLAMRDHPYQANRMLAVFPPVNGSPRRGIGSTTAHMVSNSRRASCAPPPPPQAKALKNIFPRE
jgi:hypothetical protein